MKNYTSSHIPFILLFCTSILLSQSYFDKGITLYNSEHYEEAKALFEKELEGDSNLPEVHYYLGRTYLMLGNQEKAVDHCELALDQKSDVAEYHFWLGQALGMMAMNSNVLKQAWLAPQIKDEFEKTVELDSTHIQGRIQLMNYYIQAPSFMGGDIENALEQAEIVKRQDTFNGILALAQIYEKQEKFDSALEAFNQLEKQFGDSTRYFYFYNSYGYFLLRQKHYEKAIEKFSKQVELAPHRANPYDSLGDAYMAAGNQKEAIIAYQKVLAINPNSSRTKKKLKKIE